ncbi:putative RDD family membrane protein YckC [Natronospira proteinivora]|uniref:RDD family membrane protein YckC n=1 Tax=Natronospira proteinivora TaxID=1807133 RepID=A0ABT1G4H8_9GAMM|nr:RDD family protein [Natronospira proteinivora]MCP1726195.1 putative RDD family membrane protein YckC [Natronospira proteinivora]
MSTHRFPPASLIRRLAAAFYDSLLVLAIWFLGTLIILPFARGESFDAENPLFLLYLLLLTGLFFGWFWWRSGQTLGMRAWRLQVVSPEEAQAPPPNILIRVALVLGLIVSGLYGLVFLVMDTWPDWWGAIALFPLLLSMSWSLVDAEQRCLHDILSRTRVIHIPKT